MNDRQLEKAKEIALTIYPDVDYDRTWVGFMNSDVVEPLPTAVVSEGAFIIYKGGFKFAYMTETDRLFVGLVDPKENMFI